MQATARQPAQWDTGLYGAGIVDAEALLRASLNMAAETVGETSAAPSGDKLLSVRTLLRETGDGVAESMGAPPGAEPIERRFVAELTHIAMQNSRPAQQGEAETLGAAVVASDTAASARKQSDRRKPMTQKPTAFPSAETRVGTISACVGRWRRSTRPCRSEPRAGFETSEAPATRLKWEIWLRAPASRDRQGLSRRCRPHEIADKIAKDGTISLAAYHSGDDDALMDPGNLVNLETIVRTDGTRPSFMIRDGVPDLATSPAGDWTGAIEADNLDFRAALACVGRIDDPSHVQGFRGTGTLVAPNLVLTNRHVAQGIAVQAGNGAWTLKPNIAIDFGHEFKAQKSLNRRVVKSVVFAGAEPIDLNNVVHRKLDVALLELEAPPAGSAFQKCLPLDCTEALDVDEKRVFLVVVRGPCWR
ncbi:MAG: hypothetical protein U1E19_10825 [Rhodoblastus sp.]